MFILNLLTTLIGQRPLPVFTAAAAQFVWLVTCWRLLSNGAGAVVSSTKRRENPFRPYCCQNVPDMVLFWDIIGFGLLAVDDCCRFSGANQLSQALFLLLQPRSGVSDTTIGKLMCV